MLPNLKKLITPSVDSSVGQRTIKKKVVFSLYKLIEVNNDRYKLYRKAMVEIEDKALKPVFRRYYKQSLSFKDSLAGRMKSDGAEVSYYLYPRKLFRRLWMNFNLAFPVKGREAILNSCEQMEAVAIDQYKKILAMQSLPSETTEEIYIQKENIVNAHRVIVSLSSIEALFI